MINAKGNIIEHTAVFQDDSGYRLQEHRVLVDQIGLKWGEYVNPCPRRLAFHPEQTMVVSHFRLSSEARAGSGSGARSETLLGGRQFVVYRERAMAYELPVLPTADEPRRFFELAFSESFFDGLVTADSSFLTNFQAYSATETPYYNFTAALSPAMSGIIREMQTAPYTGGLKALFLEAKAIELFLLQVRSLDRCPGSIVAPKLSAGDIERLQAAKRLLLDEKLYVGEVAERMGYRYPHHFTKAFYKKFGILPSQLRQ